MSELPQAIFLFLSVGAVALFSFIAVASWADARRREREAYYRSETLKKLADAEGGQAVADLLREEHRQAIIRRLEGLKLGGLVAVAAGVGLMVFLGGMEPKEPVYLVGLIPILVGAALLAHAFFVARRE